MTADEREERDDDEKRGGGEWKGFRWCACALYTESRKKNYLCKIVIRQTHNPPDDLTALLPHVKWTERKSSSAARATFSPQTQLSTQHSAFHSYCGIFPILTSHRGSSYYHFMCFLPVSRAGRGAGITTVWLSCCS